MEHIDKNSDIEGNSLSRMLGQITTLLWVELQNSINRAMNLKNESKNRFFSGKVTGLRFVLPLLRGDTSKLQIISSKIVFSSTLSKVQIYKKANTFRQILKIDFQVLNEGGKDGIMKEWLEGHIHAIGLALSMLQPFISDSLLSNRNTEVQFGNGNCIKKITEQINASNQEHQIKAKTKQLLLRQMG